MFAIQNVDSPRSSHSFQIKNGCCTTIRYAKLTRSMYYPGDSPSVTGDVQG